MKDKGLTPEQEAEELTKQIAWMAWKGAANSFRLYPDNNHTFTDYWAGAESQFDEFKKAIAGRSQGLERERALEAEIKRLKQYEPEKGCDDAAKYYKDDD